MMDYPNPGGNEIRQPQPVEAPQVADDTTQNPHEVESPQTAPNTIPTPERTDEPGEDALPPTRQYEADGSTAYYTDAPASPPSDPADAKEQMNENFESQGIGLYDVPPDDDTMGEIDDTDVLFENGRRVSAEEYTDDHVPQLDRKFYPVADEDWTEEGAEGYAEEEQGLDNLESGLLTENQLLVDEVYADTDLGRENMENDWGGGGY